jgi:hypothetical protein
MEQDIVTSKGPDWKKLGGVAAGRDLMETFAAVKREEREHEHSRHDSEFRCIERPS